MGFNDLKKKSGNIDKLTSELNKITKGSESYKDDRFWRPELDKSSNGYAVIRFLPPVDGEDIPWARLFSHGFQGPGGWFIENSRTTLGENDPVSEMNSELWNSGIESDKDIAPTFLWLATPQIPRMKVRFSYTSMERKSSTRLTKQ